MAAKAKGKGAAKKGGSAEGGIRLTAHPRAQRDIATAKSWGALSAFGLVLVLSLRAGVPLLDGVWRGVIGGMVGYVVAWGIGVAVWRHLALAEIERTKRELAAPPAEEPEGRRA